MERRRIGSLQVSVVGLGTNNFGRRVGADDAVRLVHSAIDAGIDFIDTADLYGETRSEEYIGRALRTKRAALVIATKFGWQLDGERRGARPAYVRRALEDSLRRLATDRIDLYQLHCPDPGTPIGDTLGALDQLVQEGKVREIGCSNFSVEQVRQAAAAAPAGSARFASVQNEYNLLHRGPELGMLAECERQGLAFLPYFPLASGMLTGKYRRGEAPPPQTRLATSAHASVLLRAANFDVVERLAAYAEAHGRRLLELTIGWLLSRPVVASVIAGATRPEQVRANVRSAGWRLNATELEQIAAILGNGGDARDAVSRPPR